MKIRLPDSIKIYGEENKLLYDSNGEPTHSDVMFSIEQRNDALIPSVQSHSEPLCYVVLKWLFEEHERRSEAVRILGDAWERGYGDLEWRGISSERCMPWYFLVSNGSDSELDVKGRHTECFGVRVHPSALCTWQYTDGGVTLYMDIRCGGKGVILGGRNLMLAEILFHDDYDCSAYQSGKAFCRRMCPHPLFPKQPVYGFNNWYYAYGKTSAKAVLEDAGRLADCTVGLPNRPYMVLDDGWQIRCGDGPWYSGNERFPDMKLLAEQIAETGVQPGIWIRPLAQKAPFELPSHWRLDRNSIYLDPSEPEVLAYVKENISRLTEWGYRLIKFDFVTYDPLGKWGAECPFLMAGGNWSFHDRTKTTAEILSKLYQTIREAAGDAVLIGCNAIGHLCAGLVELNRTGDDTSGLEWQRTRKMGVNTLAFRSLQNGTFFAADADCVGITKHVPWELNQRWLSMLAQSGSPLFVSWDPAVDCENVRKAVCEAFRINSVQQDVLIPLDWMENTCPRLWQLNDTVTEVNWYERETENILERK